MSRAKRSRLNPVLLLHDRELGGGRNPQFCGRIAQPEKGLKGWVESDLLRHCTSSYCNVRPPPRSTIATAFSPDGTLLASTHGDHTVKITCCRTGVCLRVLGSHSRTPWVVRFHPHNSKILASGSLDSHVRVWDLDTGDCIHSYKFGRPIASIAFHAGGNELAVASGHRMYIWKYNQEGLTKPVPAVVLKTRRSLRAVHYHPQGAPLLLTAEVNAGANSRRAPLPVESTGLDGQRRERRAQYERPAAAMPESIAALEVRLRVRWLELHQMVQAGAAMAQTTDHPPNPAAQVTERSLRAANAAILQARPAPDSLHASADVAASRVSGISLSIAGAPGGSQPPQPVNVPPFQASLSQWREQRGGSGQPPAETDRPYLSLSMPGPSCDRLHPLARNSMPIPTARPVDIPSPSWADTSAALDLEPQCSTSARTNAEIRHFHAMLRAGGINPEGLRRRFPIHEEDGEASRNAEPSSRIPIPKPGRRPQRSCSFDDGSIWARGCTAAITEEGDRPSTADAAAPSRQRWEAFTAERSSSRRGQTSDTTPPSTPDHPSTTETRRRNVFNFLSLRRASAPAAGESRHLFSPFFRTPERRFRGPRQPEPPQTILERISHSGGNPTDDPMNGDALMRDLPEAIEGRWSGSRQQEEQPSPSADAGQTLGLPPSLVNLGWEFPAQNIAPDEPPERNLSNGNEGEVPLEASHRPRDLPTDVVQEQRATTADVRSAAANVIGTEQPCHVLVRVWRYDPSGVAVLGALQLAIRNTVLCSDMGVHFSPCGRMLAVCAAIEGQEPTPDPDDTEGIPPYELRIYSLETGSFGVILQSRPIKAAHCLTSIQFSPCSEHIMLAYGRRHISLLRSLVADNMSSIIPVHTVLELYRVSDMSIVRVLPSADDEVNTAAFHPFAGGGIAYGTKEGRLRVLTHASQPLTKANSKLHGSNWSRLEDELLAAAHEAEPDTSDDD